MWGEILKKVAPRSAQQTVSTYAGPPRTHGARGVSESEEFGFWKSSAVCVLYVVSHSQHPVVQHSRTSVVKHMSVLCTVI